MRRARELAGAHDAATLGVPYGEGGFAGWITSGLTTGRFAPRDA